ncbi:type II toxin-antitoxin system VapC family toxin [Thermococcus barophilus]|uniref:Nucleic acid-binding protein n=1 Tax=Thermococcus barophilus (strain DSM 11836 / MP) TaxID=391623 RepID=F0LLW3_THEBM|nr:type II toxin-antitoxin system VapC family toxin [Thermococcus barophilus]ADT85062.1 nucleic acid-binding protein [Thermococcus barophilus MP]
MTSGKFRFFIDSNVILNYFYGDENAREIIEIAESIGEIFINGIVLTEVSIRYVKDKTGEKSYTLKHKPELVKNVDKSPLYAVLGKFLYLPDNVLIGEDAVTLMDIYGILPNDAIILATCKFYGIKYLISFDSDFREACEKEGITLIESKEKLNEIIKSGGSK